MATQTPSRRAAKVHSVETEKEHSTAHDRPEHGDYVLPLAHVRIPERVVNIGFWGALTGAVVVGAVDPPLAVLIGGAVLVAKRHAGSRA
jgi:hypothetical protein